MPPGADAGQAGEGDVVPEPQVQHEHREQVTSVRIVTEAVLDRDCEIELRVKNVEKNILGSLSWVALPGAAIGVTNVKIRGTLVIELFHLLPRLPLIGGIRIYFSNPPDARGADHLPGR